jgi:hypothetical protein
VLLLCCAVLRCTERTYPSTEVRVRRLVQVPGPLSRRLQQPSTRGGQSATGAGPAPPCGLLACLYGRTLLCLHQRTASDAQSNQCLVAQLTHSLTRSLAHVCVCVAQHHAPSSVGRGGGGGGGRNLYSSQITFG